MRKETKMKENEIEIEIEAAKKSGLALNRLAFSYARVSTAEQESKGNSKEDQKENAQAYAEEQGLTIIHTFSVTESAFNENRIGFNSMLEMAKMYSIQHIIFKNIDRLSRNDVDWPKCKKLAREYDLNIHLYELNKVFNASSTAEDEMFLDSTSNYAKFWSNKISQGVKRSYRNKVKRNQATRAPMGYIWDESQKNWIFDPEYKHIIDEIMNAYDNKEYTGAKIASLLNAKGYETKPKQGKFHKSTVFGILKNPFYTGYFENFYDNNFR